jgi:hypothetical protein
MGWFNSNNDDDTAHHEAMQRQELDRHEVGSHAAWGLMADNYSQAAQEMNIHSRSDFDNWSNDRGDD